MIGLDALRFSRGVPVLLQATTAECGLTCIAMVAAYFGLAVDAVALRRTAGYGSRGATLASLIELAVALGLAARPVRCEVGELVELSGPAILHWDLNHFVVFCGVRRGSFRIIDPALGERRLSAAEISAHFTGVALELWPTDGFRKGSDRRQLRFAELIGNPAGLLSGLAVVALLSVVLQVLALLAPIYIQLVVDQAIVSADVDLLWLLAAVFAGIAMSRVALEALRQLVVLKLGNRIAMRMASRLFDHLLRLPLDWFEARAGGEVFSRFGSLDAIRQTFTGAVVTVVVDGVLALATGALMCLYDVRLAMLVLLTVAIYGALRFAFFPAWRRASLEMVAAGARQDSHFMETLGAIATLRGYDGSAARLRQWQTRLAETLNRSVRVTRLDVQMRLLHGSVFGLENVAVVLLAGYAALAGELTVGMLFAFMSYKTHFVDRSAALVDRVIELKTLSVHLERLADIALEPAPQPLQRSAVAVSAQTRAGTEIGLVGVGFRFGENEPWVLRDIDFHAGAGELVAVVGHSGSGKSTLLQVLAGQRNVQRGTVRIEPRQTLLVSHEDTLLAGSLAENIAFFDDDERGGDVVAAARAAGIHDEIARLPLGYETPVAELGGTLSSGQRQRLLLARAMYRKPPVLLLDEATAHLDTALAAQSFEAIARFPATRVVVTHDLRFLPHADRAYELCDGRLKRLKLENLGREGGKLDHADGV